MPPEAETYLNTKRTAEYLDLEEQTLRKWRVSGVGPRYVRRGDSPRAGCLYRLSDLEAWLNARTFTSTSEETAAAGAAR